MSCHVVCTGLADLKQKEVIQNYCDEAVAFIQEGAMLEAFNVWDEMLNGDVYPYVACACFVFCPRRPPALLCASRV